VEQNGRETKNINGNNIICDNIKCFASMADLLLPKKRTKVEDLSTVTIGYIKNKHPDRLEENQRLRVLLDSGCSSTMTNKRFVRHWKKKPVKTIKWSTALCRKGRPFVLFPDVNYET
jgi:hypothetical protein